MEYGQIELLTAFDSQGNKRDEDLEEKDGNFQICADEWEASVAFKYILEGYS